MVCYLSNFHAIVSTRSTPISSINGHWKLECIPNSIHHLQSNVKLTAPHHRGKIGLGVREGTTTENMAKLQENTKSISPFGNLTLLAAYKSSVLSPGCGVTKVEHFFTNNNSRLPGPTFVVENDVENAYTIKRNALLVRTPWCIIENESGISLHH